MKKQFEDRKERLSDRVHMAAENSFEAAACGRLQFFVVRDLHFDPEG